MPTYTPTTPFGRRTLRLAHVTAQAIAKSRSIEKAVHKWNLFRAICTAKQKVGVTERALAVLDALLSFHPETVLTGEDLIVFPSNTQLSLRAHGMAPSTLRRHLGALVDAGLIVRRDSPNGKRYARKQGDGAIERAFGFDLSPLVVRAEEFEAWAEDVRAEDRAIRLARERITICRRDIVKMIATAIEEGVKLEASGQGLKDWADAQARYRDIIGRLPRKAPRLVLEPIAEELTALADDILMILERHEKNQNLSSNESHSERHKQNSNPNDLTVFEPDFPKKQGATIEPSASSISKPEKPFPLGMVLDACPDLVDYAKGGISNWRDFLAAIAVVRPMLGISPSAFEAAQEAMGEISAGITIAAILQKGAAIKSAGGYLRDLTERSQRGEFSVGPMLMALIGSRSRLKKSVG